MPTCRPPTSRGVRERAVARPPPRPHVAVGRAEPAQGHQDQPQRRIGDGVRQDVGGVAHADTPALGRVEIDRIHAGAVVDDRLQVGQRRDEIGVDAGGSPRHRHAKFVRMLGQEFGPSGDRREAVRIS